MLVRPRRWGARTMARSSEWTLSSCPNKLEKVKRATRASGGSSKRPTSQSRFCLGMQSSKCAAAPSTPSSWSTRPCRICARATMSDDSTSFNLRQTSFVVMRSREMGWGPTPAANAAMPSKAEPSALSSMSMGMPDRRAHAVACALPQCTTAEETRQRRAKHVTSRRSKQRPPLGRPVSSRVVVECTRSLCPVARAVSTSTREILGALGMGHAPRATRTGLVPPASHRPNDDSE
mmetsp:Transcript_24113/g.65265  ORF Transcript_24113/g.65265 Transcript_24113/m.65265 type:complete len:234 (+) Transcript_24113:1183-1884(+)